MSNAMDHTNWNIIENLVDAARLMPKSICQDWKQKKENHVPTHSSASTVEETILPTLINVHFGIISSIGNGIWENTVRSMKTDLNQFVLKRTALLTNDCGKYQDLFAKHLQELSLSQYPPRNLNPFQHHLNPGTPVVWNP